MSVHCEIVDGRIELSLNGHFSIEEALDTLTLAIEDAGKPYPILIDAAKSLEFKQRGELEYAASTLQSYRERMVPKIAVVSPDAARFGNARQLGAYLEQVGIQSRPFYSKTEAAEWLNAEE